MQQRQGAGPAGEGEKNSTSYAAPGKFTRGNSMDDRSESIYWETLSLETKEVEYDHLLSTLFKEDERFWSELSDDEQNNAWLLQRIKDVFLEGGFLQSEELDSDLADICNINYYADKIMSRYGSMPPTKLIALMDAINMESSSREFILHLAGNKPDQNVEIKLLKKLAQAKTDHLKKITEKLQCAQSVLTGDEIRSVSFYV
jgi:hypothetical protein